MTTSKNPTLLLVDDDEAFTRTATRVMERRGFDVLAANDIAGALQIANKSLGTLAYAVIDLMIGNESGLTLVPRLRALNPAMRILVLTGYASIATAVEAIKLGADNYLAKPADAAAIIAALNSRAPTGISANETPLSIDRLEWEHIQRVLNENAGNISATARALNMHRRTLQRKLAKRPVKT
jgi:two-component system, response regulator RegA